MHIISSLITTIAILQFMIDQIEIELISGNGGDGAISGRREKFVPHGGPDGGDGGKGGDIVFCGAEGMNTLTSFQRRRVVQAENGGNGAGSLKSGRSGSDVKLEVPVGTEVRDVDAPHVVIVDLASHGQKWTVAEGGRGGRGNARFTSSITRFPVIAEKGEAGRRVKVRLELKLLADVGIVGVPNAGKSTLLSTVSRARPTIADYPFTTLEPVLGVVTHHGNDVVMVDIPGLIEGAHKGAGLGDQFLRHIQRTKVIVHLLDGTSEDVWEDYRKIRHELAAYGADLADKPEVVAINKVDIPGVEQRWSDGPVEVAGGVHFISAAARSGITELLDQVTATLSKIPSVRDAPVVESPRSELPVVRPRPVDIAGPVRKIGDGYVVTLPAAERVADRINTGNWEAVVQLYDYLEELGVMAALESAGIKAGDVFRVGKKSWEWE